MTIDEKLEILHDSIKSLENIATAHQTTIEVHEDSIAAHDRQIEALIKNAQKYDALAAAVADLSRQLQAYLTRIPPQ
jgi:3-methyladenine DNA glycosylase Tag